MENFHRRASRDAKRPPAVRRWHATQAQIIARHIVGFDWQLLCYRAARSAQGLARPVLRARARARFI